MKPQITSLCAVAVMLSACADSGAEYTPILDGQPTAAFHSDLSACQSLARNQTQLDQETVAAAALGAGAGGVLGALDDEGDAAGGAVVGAIAGGVSGAVNASERREEMVIACLRGRGHKVVG
ncbi:glycine zipper family protein [Aliishimia ponticola]|uniref:Glycine zipper family protein n=1 Tax=Aliishimia ponticola TaxID=2499833 RepID=A0A4S4NH02_9RHOB|nr:glycine zipper family protein [Aliishimia ponticola]THH38105.1 glycine zipper family protein [Aliishimia ponticola]